MPGTSSTGRNLHLCLLKIKRPSSSSSQVSQNDHDRPFSTALIKNFNSLYDHVEDGKNDLSSPEPAPAEGAAVDFAAVLASRRFFFSSPGRSNSIVDSSPSHSPSSLSPPESDAEPAVKVGSDAGGVAVPTYSPDPYADFRRSMQEMVEARGCHDVRSDWEYLQELLLRYLGLNPKNTHKFIVGAFADLIVSLMSPAGGGPRRDDDFVGGLCNTHAG